MRKFNSKLFILMATLFLYAGIAGAQAITSTGSTQFTGTATESLSITVPASGTLTFDAAGHATTSPNVVSAVWIAGASRQGVILYSGISAQSGGLSLNAQETVNGVATANTCNLTASGLNSYAVPGGWAPLGGPGTYMPTPAQNCSVQVLSSSPNGIGKTASATYSYVTTGANTAGAYSLTVAYTGVLY